jgi:CheY-like chemotaxis protein
MIVSGEEVYSSIQTAKIVNEDLFKYQSKLNGQKLLVVDDEPDTLMLLKTIFEHCGAIVEKANSVEAAIEILEKWTPNILISDIGMPGRNGFDLIKYVRARDAERGSKIPAVALTAFARIEDRVKVLTAGYQMHIPKPVEPDELISIVSSLTKIIHKQ